MEDLITKAKELGIENAETLTAPQLKKAIEKAAKEKTAIEALVAKAIELGIEVHEPFDADQLTQLVEEKELELEADKQDKQQAEFFGLLSSHFGVENIAELSIEELKELLATKSANPIEETPVLISGKTDQIFETSKGIKYQFTTKAPESFRFLGIVKTQKDWIEDHDSMELMIEGNLSYVKPVKK